MAPAEVVERCWGNILSFTRLPEREFVVPAQVSWWAREPAAHVSHEMLDVCGHLVLSRDFRPFWFPSVAFVRSGFPQGPEGLVTVPRHCRVPNVCKTATTMKLVGHNEYSLRRKLKSKEGFVESAIALSSANTPSCFPRTRFSKQWGAPGHCRNSFDV